MQIQVKLMGLLKDSTPPNGALDLPDHATIDDVIQALQIDVATTCVLTVNGQLERNRQRALAENDQLAIVPPVGGG